MKVLTSDRILEKIEDLLKRTKESVWISSAWLKGNVLEGLLGEIQKDNLDFKVVLRASELQDLLITDEKVFELIKNKGGKIYLHPRLHAKFILVDGKYAVVGSANFTFSGLSEFSKGNVEAAVYYDENDDPKEIEELKKYFNRIISEKETYQLNDSLVGFAMNPVKSRSFEFVVLGDVKEQDYVELRDGKRKLIGRILEIYSYDMDFFANPFTSGESPVFGSLETFKLLFAKGNCSDWKKAAVLAYLNGNGAKLKLAVAEVIGELKEDKLETSFSPAQVGSPVFKLVEGEISSLLKKDFSGQSMASPVEVGELVGSSATAYLDAQEVLSKHLLVLGTTGSGKSYFTKLFLSRLLSSDPEVKLFILDPHGEYKEGLLKFGVDESQIDELKIEDILLPVFPEEVEEQIRQEGYPSLVSGNTNEAKKNRALLSKYIKPSLFLTGFREKDLKDIISEFSDREGEKEALLSSLSSIYDGQKDLIEKLESTLNSNKRVVIFNFGSVSEPSTRVNVSGLIMRELFDKAREDKKKRFLVLEEAHNFAPEKGFGDTSAGKGNLALIMARKIASEGRKFNLGLGVITQRPAQVSKYILSQTNTQVMFRTINSSDLDVISSFVEYAGKDIVSLLPSLQTGMGIICGMGAPFPMVVNVK